MPAKGFRNGEDPKTDVVREAPHSFEKWGAFLLMVYHERREFMTFFFGGGFEILFFLMFFTIFGVFLVTVIRGIGQWNKNNHSPRLTVEATVVTKRTNVSRHHHTNGAGHTSTSYYVTFEVESGDRMELRVNGYEYGMLAEGDHGQLSFQGTRYLGFERIKDGR